MTARAQANAAEIQIAVGSDERQLRPSLVTVMSVLESTRPPVDIHFLEVGLSDASKVLIERAVRLWPGARLHHHDMSCIETNWKQFEFDGRWSPAMMAHLDIPNLISGGKVLYLDSDTLVHSSVRPLFEIDMDGYHIAAVRDYDLMMKHQFNERLDMRSELVGKHERAIAPHPISDFFNAGVILYDIDSIKSEPSLLDALADRSGTGDDGFRLNASFKGRVCHINPRWNAICGIHHMYFAVHTAVVGREIPYVHRPPAISHFTGIVKPWHDVDLDELKSNFKEARMRAFRDLGLESHKQDVNAVFHHLKSDFSIAEYVQAHRIYRKSHARFMGMLGG